MVLSVSDIGVELSVCVCSRGLVTPCLRRLSGSGLSISGSSRPGDAVRQRVAVGVTVSWMA